MGQDGEEKEERKDGDKAQKSRGQKVRERWATKESGLYKKKPLGEGQPRSCALEFRVRGLGRGWGIQVHPVTDRD